MKRFLFALGICLLLAWTRGAVARADWNDCAHTYYVQKGDTLSLIAQRFFGDKLSYPTIVTVTNSLTSQPTITDPDKIKAGKRICLSRTRVYPALAVAPKPGARALTDNRGQTLGNGGYRVNHYTVDVEWAPPNTITGTTSFIAQTTQDLSSFALDLHGFEITRLAVNAGYPLVERRLDKVIVHLNQPIAKDEIFDVQVQYHGAPEPVTIGSRTRGWFSDKGGAVTVCNDPFGALSWFPSNDYPGDLAVYDVTITVPDTFTVIRVPAPSARFQYANPIVSEGTRVRFPIPPRSVRPTRAPNFAIATVSSTNAFACPNN